MKGVIWIFVIATVLNVDAKPAKQSRALDCSVQPEGTRSPNETSCSWYFECQGGVAASANCGPANYFNPTTLGCVPDTDNICPESGCVTEGAVLGSPTECYAYYICYGGKNVEQICAAGQYFNKTTLNCLPDEGNACPQSICSAEGQLIPHPTNCSLFYVCHAGEKVEQSCTSDSYFNKTDLACLPDTDNICVPQTGCGANGAISAHPTECNMFNVCYNGTLVEQKCINGSYFDEINLYCVPDTDNVCEPTTPGPPCSCEGDLTPNPDSCYLYFNCSGGILVGGSCGNGSYFDSCSKTCQIDTTGDCWPLTDATTPDPCTSSCSGGLQENDVVSIPDKCFGFLRCVQGQLVEDRCKDGEYFDDATKNCIVDENNLCCPASG